MYEMFSITTVTYNCYTQMKSHLIKIFKKN